MEIFWAVIRVEQQQLNNRLDSGPAVGSKRSDENPRENSWKIEDSIHPNSNTQRRWFQGLLLEFGGGSTVWREMRNAADAQPPASQLAGIDGITLGPAPLLSFASTDVTPTLTLPPQRQIAKLWANAEENPNRGKPVANRVPTEPKAKTASKSTLVHEGHSSIQDKGTGKAQEEG
ncbi:hypothetical protein K438DRAFT_1993497 [Mycena galopus ATCC 62051]|nr:hypothetical protein K438DRAFT_1993497 [Mycena galopus ATCC 62051]